MRAAHGEPVLAPAAVALARNALRHGSNVLGEDRGAPDRLREGATSADGRRSRHSSSATSVSVYTFTATPYVERMRTSSPSRKRWSKIRRRTTTTKRIKSFRAASLLAARSMPLICGMISRFNPPPQQFRPLPCNGASRIGAHVVSGTQPVDPPDVTETKTQSTWIDLFLASLTIAPVRNSRLVDVRFESPTRLQVLAWRIHMANHTFSSNLEFKFNVERGAGLADRAARRAAQAG